MAEDLSRFSLARFPLLRRWKRSEHRHRLSSAWRYPRSSVWSERFFYGPNELRIEAVLLFSSEDANRFLRHTIDSNNGVPWGMPVSEFANGLPRSIGSGRAIHLRERRTVFAVWLFSHAAMIRRGHAELEQDLPQPQQDRLLRAVAAELRKRAEAFPPDLR